MESSSYTIHARVGSGALDKADRLFRNDDTGTFVELLQNSRRAGATVVEVTINEPDPSNLLSVVTIHDNGRGIQDFAQLLTLWESGWDQTTKTTEDPAGIGFYSLCRSGVEVFSGNQYCKITPEAFLGKASATVEQREECVAGTKLRFIRSGNLATLASALRKAAEFYPIEVRLNGESLPRHDFLAGAVHREVIDGVEVGFPRASPTTCIIATRTGISTAHAFTSRSIALQELFQQRQRKVHRPCMFVSMCWKQVESSCSFPTAAM